jgi:hypothetical protein
MCIRKNNFLWAIGRVSQYKNGKYLFLLHEKSHFFREIEQNSPHFMVSAVKSASHLFRPYIFDSPLNQNSYFRMLEKHPFLRSDTVSTRRGHCEFFSLYPEILRWNLWSLKWPPHSREFSWYNHEICKVMKHWVAKQCWNVTGKQKQALHNAFAAVTIATPRFFCQHKL